MVASECIPTEKWWEADLASIQTLNFDLVLHSELAINPYVHQIGSNFSKTK